MQDLATVASLVESSEAIHDLEIPDDVDWVWFYRYSTINLINDTAYQSNHSGLKSKLKSHQKMMAIMESQWLPYNESEGFE